MQLTYKLSIGIFILIGLMSCQSKENQGHVVNENEVYDFLHFYFENLYDERPTYLYSESMSNWHLGMNSHIDDNGSLVETSVNYLSSEFLFKDDYIIEAVGDSVVRRNLKEVLNTKDLAFLQSQVTSTMKFDPQKINSQNITVVLTEKDSEFTHLRPEEWRLRLSKPIFTSDMHYCIMAEDYPQQGRTIKFYHKEKNGSWKLIGLVQPLVV